MMVKIDFNREMDREYFVRTCQWAGKELEVLVDRLGKAKAVKANLGLYAGGNVPAGFYIDGDPKSDTYEMYCLYQPHQEIVLELFEIAFAIGSIAKIYYECQSKGLYFPLFDNEIAQWMGTRSALRLCKAIYDLNGEIQGYRISRSLLRGIFTNPIYMGRPIRNGKMLDEGKIPAIVDFETFKQANMILFNGVKPRGKSVNTETYPLQGLLYSSCADGESRPIYHSIRKAKQEGWNLKCGGHDNYPDHKVCIRIADKIIRIPIENYVLSQVNFSNFAETVVNLINLDRKKQTKINFEAVSQRKKLKQEIEILKKNFLYLDLDKASAKLLQEELDEKINLLSTLDDMGNSKKGGNDLSNEDITFVQNFLSNLQPLWHKIPNNLKSRFFALILRQIVVSTLPDNNFLLDVTWKQDCTETLWVERPSMNSKCIPWTDDEKRLLAEKYTHQPLEELVDCLPGKNIDSIRTMANRLGLKRSASNKISWSGEDDENLKDYVAGNLTFWEMKYKLRYHYSNEIKRRAAKLDLEWPPQNTVKWHIVNTEQIEGSCPK
jgi:hypothetical protein